MDCTMYIRQRVALQACPMALHLHGRSAAATKVDTDFEDIHCWTHG